MAITTYDSLVAEVKAWTARSDSTFSNRFPSFVQMVEDRIYNGSGNPGDPLYSPPLRTRAMETTAEITITDGVGTLPADPVDLRGLTRAGDDTGLTYAEPASFKTMDVNAGAGFPYYYTVEGNTLRVSPSWTGTLTASFTKRLAAITQENQTGELIGLHGLLYFNACMFEAYSFMQEPDLALAWLAKYRSMLDGLNRVASSTRTTATRTRIRARAIG